MIVFPFVSCAARLVGQAADFGHVEYAGNDVCSQIVIPALFNLAEKVEISASSGPPTN